MGVLWYEQLSIVIDDRTLAHVQVVILDKVRRNESFFLSWKVSPELGGGRTSVWLNPAISLRFHYDNSRPVSFNPMWIDRLRRSANSERGLEFIDEKDKTA